VTRESEIVDVGRPDVDGGGRRSPEPNGSARSLDDASHGGESETVPGAGLATLAGGLQTCRPDLVDGMGVIVGIDRFMSEAREVLAGRRPFYESAFSTRDEHEGQAAESSATPTTAEIEQMVTGEATQTGAPRR